MKHKITFGLTKKHIEEIEKFDDLYSYYTWIDIGKKINWDPLTACLHYFRTVQNFENNNSLVSTANKCGKILEKVSNLSRSQWVRIIVEIANKNN